MAYNDVEIEIRFLLNKETFFKVKEKLKEIAKLVKTLKQIDDYFTPVHRNFVEPKIPSEWLRIGQRGDRAILNYKHWHIPEDADSGTHCDEFETEIKDANQLEKILSALNFKKLVTVDKEREVYIYNDEFEIVLDVVKELGHFIEIEAIKDFGTVEEARERLFEFAKNLGVDTSNQNKLGYPFSLMQKKGLLKQKPI